MGLPLRDGEHHTYTDYLGWPEEVRYELIDGTAYAMAPAPTRVHQEFVLQIAHQLVDALNGTSCRPFIAPFDVRLPHGQEADDAVDTVVQPDVSVVCDPSKLDERGCRGAPDWVVEVLSPTTASHDLIIKRRAYERAGVREYWLVHPTDRVVTVYIRGEQGFGAPEIYELQGQLASKVLPRVQIDWERVLANVG
jgi:Uma2 family endonuclease